MRGRLVLYKHNKFKDIQSGVSKVREPYDYEVSIKTLLDKDYESIISDPYNFENDINLFIKMARSDEKVKFYEDFKKNRIDMIRNAEYLTIKARPETVANFIKNNPELGDKKIVFEDYGKADTKLLNMVREAFKENTSNIYFELHANKELITFEEFEKTISIINQKVNEIERLNLSPLEKIMYAYDMVRDRVYEEEDENEDKSNSRSLTSVLLGNKIVCVGYSKIFQAILNKLGIDCNVTSLYDKETGPGHERNVVHVKDSKYGVDGVYYFDTTWDSKKNEADNSFLLSYRCFALTKQQIDKLENGRFIEDSFQYFSPIMAWVVKAELEKVDLEELSPKIVDSINQMSYLVNKKKLVGYYYPNLCSSRELIATKEEVVNELIELVDYFDAPLPAETLVEVLYNVRKQQYYANPEKYPFGLDEFYRTVVRSGWDFSMTPHQKTLMQSLSLEDQYEVKCYQLLDYISKKDLERQVEEVQLAKVLTNVYEKKRAHR